MDPDESIAVELILISKKTMTVQASSTMNALEQRDARCQRRARFIESESKTKSERERKKKNAAIARRHDYVAHSHIAALSDGPRDDPRRLETVRAPLRRHPASPFAITSPRASSRFRNETLEIRENATKTIGEHALLFAKNRFY